MKLIKVYETACFYPEFAADGKDPKVGEVIEVDDRRQRTIALLCDRGYAPYLETGADKSKSKPFQTESVPEPKASEPQEQSEE